MKKFIRDEMGESWYEEEEEVSLSTDEYNKYLVFDGIIVGSGRLDIWFDDSSVLYYGHGITMEPEGLELVGAYLS